MAEFTIIKRCFANATNTDSLAVSHKLADGSHVLSISEHPLQRIRYSTRPLWTRRPMTASTSQKKSSGAAAFSTSTAVAMAMAVLPGWLSERSILRDFLRDSSSSSSAIFLTVFLDRERFL